MSRGDYDYAIALLRAAMVADCGPAPISVHEALTWHQAFQTPPADVGAPPAPAGALSGDR